MLAADEGGFEVESLEAELALVLMLEDRILLAVDERAFEVDKPVPEVALEEKELGLVDEGVIEVVLKFRIVEVVYEIGEIDGGGGELEVLSSKMMHVFGQSVTITVFVLVIVTTVEDARVKNSCAQHNTATGRQCMVVVVTELNSIKGKDRKENNKLKVPKSVKNKGIRHGRTAAGAVDKSQMKRRTES